MLVRKELESTNVELQKSKASRYIQSFILLIERLLEGSIIGDPDRFGETLSDEKTSSGTNHFLPTSLTLAPRHRYWRLANRANCL